MKAIGIRPHVQGSAAGIRLEQTRSELTDGAGLLMLRQVWDSLDLGTRIDHLLCDVGGQYQPSLLAEQWTSLLLYGGYCMDHLPLLEKRGVQTLFGWKSVVDATTFGRFLRRAGSSGAKALDGLLRQVVRARWDAEGQVPKAVKLIFDSTVVQRYGTKQAGACKGYNPQKKGRPSHHPLLAFTSEGDCLGVRWRPGNANTAAGFEPWLTDLVGWLRAQGVRRILVRLDKGFFKASHIKTMLELDVDFVLKMQQSKTLQAYKGTFIRSGSDPRLEVAEGARWGARLLSVRQCEEAPEGELALGAVVLKKQLTIVTNLSGIDPLTAWRIYNEGAVVEHRIEELGQLGVGRTAINDLGGNHLLWSLGALAYQLLHLVRTTALGKSHQRKQVRTLRTLLLRTPGKLVRHARGLKLRLLRDDPLRRLLGRAAERLRFLRPITQVAAAM